MRDGSGHGHVQREVQTRSERDVLREDFPLDRLVLLALDVPRLEVEPALSPIFKAFSKQYAHLADAGQSRAVLFDQLDDAVHRVQRDGHVIRLQA
jgi:hypothetical protein